VISRFLWIITAGLAAAAMFCGDNLGDVYTASVIDSGRSPITFGSIIAGWGATIASWTGYRSDVPWFGTNKGDTWSERQIKRAADYIDDGGSELERLRRTLQMTLPIAALAILFYGEDSFRNFGLLDAARFGPQ